MSAIDTTARGTQTGVSAETVSELSRFRLKLRRSPLTPRGIAFRLFFTCWLVFALHFATNSVREIYPALTLGDRLSFDVSEYDGLHPDIFSIPGRGAYINNNPGASIIGAIPYAISRPIIDRVVQRVAEGRKKPDGQPNEYKSVYPLAQQFYREAQKRGIDVKLGLGAAVMQAFAMAPLSALSVVVMFYILLSRTNSTKQALLLSLLYAFATPVFYRTAQLNQNLLVAHCALFAFAVLWRPWDNAENRLPPRYFLAGLLCGWAVVLDYSGLVVLLVLAGYAVVHRASLPATLKSRADIPLFMAGVSICAALLMGYQWSAFGNPLLPAQSYMPPTRFSGYGYRGMAWPQLDLLWDTTFGTRFGLFTSAPLLLLALYIPAWFKKQHRIVGKQELVCIATFSCLFLLFCAANQYGRLQFNSGVRYALPVVPFLFLIASNVMLRMRPMVAVLIGAAATYWSWCLSMYRDVELGLGIFESLKQVTLTGFRLPWMTSLHNLGYIGENTSVLPVLLIMVAVIAIFWKVELTRTA